MTRDQFTQAQIQLMTVAKVVRRIPLTQLMRAIDDAQGERPPQATGSKLEIMRTMTHALLLFQRTIPTEELAAALDAAEAMEPGKEPS